MGAVSYAESPLHHPCYLFPLSLAPQDQRRPLVPLDQPPLAGAGDGAPRVAAQGTGPLSLTGGAALVRACLCACVLCAVASVRECGGVWTEVGEHKNVF